MTLSCVCLCVCMYVCAGVPVVFDDNEADRNRLSSEFSLPPQTHTAAYYPCTCVGCVRVRGRQIRDRKSQLDAVLMKLIKKDGKSKHFVLCDNKMPFFFLAIIGCFLIRDYCSAILLCE